MKKYIRITMSDGSQWDVSTDTIAKDRAAYYAKRDSEKHGEDYDTVYRSEYEHTMTDGDDALDYMQNNMSWSELNAIMVNPPSPDYSQEWVNADFDFVTKDEQP